MEDPELTTGRAGLALELYKIEYATISYEKSKVQGHPGKCSYEFMKFSVKVFKAF